MSRKLIADFDKMIIKPLDRSTETIGNFIIPDTGKERPEIGIIVSIGPGAYSLTGNFIPTTMKVGQEVVIPKFGTTVITLEGQDYYLVKEIEMYAHFEEVSDELS